MRRIKFTGETVLELSEDLVAEGRMREVRRKAQLAARRWLVVLLARSELDDQDQTWAVEGALVKLAASFERLMLDALVAAINNDSHHLSAVTGLDFPKHMTDEVCEYIVTGGGYFDYRGRSGLIQTLKRHILDSHYLVTDVKKPKYKDPIEQLIAY